jgi:hypothetical protein
MTHGAALGERGFCAKAQRGDGLGESRWRQTHLVLRRSTTATAKTPTMIMVTISSTMVKPAAGVAGVGVGAMDRAANMG